jgi:hypothetical protein
MQVHELSGCGDFLSALELAQCVDSGSALVAGLHVSYGDDMFRKVCILNFARVPSRLARSLTQLVRENSAGP